MKQKLIIAFCFLLLAFSSKAQPNNSDADYVKANYTKYEYQILMRDGIKLFTSVYVPKDQSKKYPIMMDRTPYSVGPYGPDAYKGSLGPSSLFLHDGFIFVYQDVRGRFMSEGLFEEMTPEKEAHKTKKDVDEGDGILMIPSTGSLRTSRIINGKVGVWGISYPGYFKQRLAY